MTEIATHPSVASPRWQQVATSLICIVRRAMIAYRTRQTLNELPDRILKDVGINRGEIDFVANTIASNACNDEREQHRATTRLGLRLSLGVAIVMALLFSAFIGTAAYAQEAQIKRGKYLVTIGGCNDCHTPGYFFGKPEMTRFLGGSEVGFEIPGLGVFHGPNLTPDPETGLGAWSLDQIATAITTGKRPDGRMLSPIMPWHAFANLTTQDVRAIAVFLKSLPPVKNKVPGPFGPNETPTSFVMKIVPPQASAAERATND